MSYKAIISAALTAALMIVTPAVAQQWPEKPINMITGSNAGGNSDLFGRIFGDAFQRQTGQPWIMNNRPGSNTTVAIEMARQLADEELARLILLDYFRPWTLR